MKDSTEADFWDLDDVPAALPEAEPLPPAQARKGRAGSLPPLAETRPVAAAADSPNHPVLEAPVGPQGKTSQKPKGPLPGPSRSRQKSPGAEATPTSGNPAGEALGNLEHWDLGDETFEMPLEAAPARPVPPASPAAREVALAPEPARATPAVASPPPPAAARGEASEQDEFSPASQPDATPISLRPALRLTRIELGGLIALAVILVVGGVWVYENTVSRLVSQASQTQAVKFPLQGKFVTVTKVATYWRRPVKTDGQMETVRRGVVLIPVTEVTLRGGPAAIRVQVHNDVGRAVGDPITRPVDGDTTLSLPATDGFDDISMHAAYLTGQTPPWTVRLFEAPSTNSPGTEFKKLLEIPIATEKR